MWRPLAALILIAGCGVALAQTGGGGITPTGTITPGDCMKWGPTKFKAADAGAACGSGTVTSVGLALPTNLFVVTGSPVVGAGTITGTLTPQSANIIFAGPSTGGAVAPTFRSLVNADLPDIITAGGPTGSSSVIPVITWNSKGVLTAVSSASISVPTAGNPTQPCAVFSGGSGVATTFMRSDATCTVDPAGTYAFSALGLTHISDATQSTTSTTGSLTTAGGLGVVKDAFFGNKITSFNDIQTTGGSFTLSAAGSVAWLARGQFTSPAAFVIQLGIANAAAPAGYTLQGQGSRAGTDNNIGGANVTIASGTGTGTGSKSGIILQTPTSVTSGNTAQTMLTSMIITNGAASIGSAALNLSAGAFGITKITSSAVAPGALGGKLELTCGATAGTARLIAYAGTSATPVTVVDNIGTGVSGC